MRRELLLLGLICVLGLGLRLYALGWGLPYVEHPDEPALVEVAVRMVREGDPNPRNFLYPSLFFYAMAGVTRLHAWWGMQQGIYRSLADLPVDTYLYTTAPDLYLWNRALSAILGALTVPALATLGWRMFDRRVGLLAALLLAVARFHVEHSHFITTDAATGLWVVLAMLGAWGVASDGGWRGYLLGGLACGLAAGTKYNAGVVALALAAAHLLFWRADSLRASGRLLACGGLALLTFGLTTPYALLDWPRFLAALRFNAEHYASGSHGDMVGRWPLGEYAEVFWTLLLFPSGTLALLVGLPLLLRRFPRQSALIGLVVLAELVLLLSYAVHFVRNLLPIVPLLLLMLAAGAVALADWLRQRLRERGPALASKRASLASGLLLAVLLLAALLPQASDTAWLLGYWGRPYTLVAAAEALRSQPRGLPAMVESNPVQWAGDPAALPVERLTAQDAAWYRAGGVRFLLLNEDRHRDDPQATTALAAAGRVLAAFPERRMGIQPGPGATLVDLAPRPEDLAITRRATVFSDTIELLGYAVQSGPPRARLGPLDQPGSDRLSAGAGMQLNMVWRALKRPDRDYILFIHILAPDGTRVAQRDLPLRAADYPSSHWAPGELVLDSGDLDTSGLPPGAYRVLFGLYDATGARLPVSAGDPEGLLMTLTVE
ncbi:MAG: hypothetical protein OHK0022_57520 [Roseiflexaceae bacterium]